MSPAAIALCILVPLFLFALVFVAWVYPHFSNHARSTMKYALLFTLLVIALLGCGAQSVQPKLASTATPHTLTVTFVGDSISFLWQSHEDFPSRRWTDKAISGVNSNVTLAHFQADVIDARPDVVHILTGTNDIVPGWKIDGSNTSLPFTTANITQMVIQAQDAGIRPIVCTIPPWGIGIQAHNADNTPGRFDNIIALNNWIRMFAAAAHIRVIEYHDLLVDPANGMHYLPGLTDPSDGVHPTQQGYDLMTPLLEKTLTSM